MKLKQISKIISDYRPYTLPQTPTEAAVLILLVHNQDDDVYLVITKRSQHVAKYAGDYCFPGGTKDIEDIDFHVTIKREVKEELGMCEESYQIIGQLDDFHDRYNHLVRPYVATIAKENFEARIGHEVEQIHFFPLRDLQNLHVDKDLERITKRHPTYKYVDGEVVIWGLTASIMVHLYNILFDKKYVIGKSPV